MDPQDNDDGLEAGSEGADDLDPGAGSDDSNADDGSADDGDASSAPEAADDFDARGAYEGMQTAMAGQAAALRYAGRIPELQSTIARMEQKLGALDGVESTNERLTLLTNALFGQLDPADQQRITDATTSSNRAADIAQARAELREEFGVDDPQEFQEQAPAAGPEAQSATAEIAGYAADKGIDWRGIPDTVFDSAEALVVDGDYTLAEAQVKRHIDRMAAKDGAPERRAARRSDGVQKKDVPAGKSGAGAITAAKLRTMTSPADQKEMVNWTDEQWEAALDAIENE